ncbi:hypothetical protein ACKBNH_004344 [Vibrio vulnificus]|uniref:hypothetical protein n=1 Tax=Vibrio parahaemolyticus TaxID=670 RepID=UPI001EE9E578|nr:hypothetical protein [Vibrio parahaemolyticus]MCG6490034.1 hypothetical protein [Vibrio parahaemolyticus]
MIQEPTDSTFIEKQPQARNATLKRRISFYVQEIQRAEISAYTGFPLTCPFHTLRPKDLPQPNAILSEATYRTLACFTVGDIQEFEPTMLICRDQKTVGQRD